MENVTAYGIAIIGGAFTIVGALIGVLSTYWLAIKLARIQERRVSCAKFRAAFAPALAKIYLARHHGNHDRPDDHAFIKSELLKHAAAIEEFRAFVSERELNTYQEAWESYRQAANQDFCSRIADEWGRYPDEKPEVSHGEIIEEKIRAVLAYAET